MKITDRYPTMAKFKHRIWLHTNLHPFGFFAGETKPAIDIRISCSSSFQGVSMEDRVHFLIEADRRMVEMGYTRQRLSGEETAAFIRQTESRAVLWYSLPWTPKTKHRRGAFMRELQSAQNNKQQTLKQYESLHSYHFPRLALEDRQARTCRSR